MLSENGGLTLNCAFEEYAFFRASKSGFVIGTLFMSIYFGGAAVNCLNSLNKKSSDSGE